MGFQTLSSTNPSFTRALNSASNFVSHTSVNTRGRNTAKYSARARENLRQTFRITQMKKEDQLLTLTTVMES